MPSAGLAPTLTIASVHILLGFILMEGSGPAVLQSTGLLPHFLRKGARGFNVTVVGQKLRHELLDKSRLVQRRLQIRRAGQADF
jgi:hypothetical protein